MAQGERTSVGVEGDAAVLAAIARIGAIDWRSDARRDVEMERPQSFGAYEGLPPRLALLRDGRLAQVLAGLAYIAPDGTRWEVPAGIEVDGASIPRALWTLIGGPFEGRYRDASIVHDHFCATRSRPWRATHRMFHDAVRCSGVGAVKAKILFYSVYRFGPRWPEALEAITTQALEAEALTAATAPSLAFDAEAIATHDLSLDEIETLADARADDSATPMLERAAGDPSSLARLLCVTGGRGDAADLAQVVAHAAHLPAYVLARFERKGVRIVACRDSVTDFERDLRGVVPRGWDSTGKTWDDVPGAYLPSRKRVVIATIDSGGARVIPPKSAGTHGSADLLVHEALHGFDFATGHAVLGDPRFRRARDTDLARLDVYERQAGDAGLQETFAESGARFFVENAAMAANLPALHAYWTAGPSDGERAGDLESVQGSGNDPLGTVELRADGAIEADLRAEGPDGAIGHARFTVEPREPKYAALRSQVFPAELEGVGDAGPRLFYPSVSE